MNWITITVIAIIALLGAYGWYKGILSIVLSFAATIVTILVTIIISPMIANGLKENTTLYDKLEDTICNAIENNSSYSEAVDETLSEEQQVEYIDSNGEISTYIQKIVDVLNLPSSIENQVDSVVSQDTVNEYLTEGTQTARDMVTQIIAERLADMIFSTIIYMIVFFIVMTILRVIMRVTGLFSRLPVIHQLNKCGGLVFGLAEGIIIVWLLFLFITLFSSTEWAEQALTDINNNKFLEFIYNNNWILNSTLRSL